MISISRLYCGAAGPGDSLRYGKGDLKTRPRPGQTRPVVVWNVTRRCNLLCAHCYSASSADRAPDELTTDEARAMLEDLAAFGCPVVLFSGGEPLLREDILELIGLAGGAGLRTVLSTNGTLIMPELAGRLREAGLGYAGVSLDGMRATNDRFRGAEGAFEQALAGIRNCIRADLRVGLRLTMTAHNIVDLPAIFSLARDEGIRRLCFYHLVPTGRGGAMAGAGLDHASTRRALDLIIDRTAELHAAGEATEVLTVDNHADGPYLYLRMLREGNPRAAEALGLLRAGGGNSSGRGIGCVSWDGTVHPDQFWRSVSLGSVRERPLSTIWTDLSDPLVARLKDKARHVTGRCAGCRFLDCCGGNSRARAEALTGERWASDPACHLSDEEILAETTAAATAEEADGE
ncbi:MAG TPA: radical SAM protein [Phycisphaerae bacterium]|nr:radical SAM protein [Phycisphaerae bacterium]